MANPDHLRLLQNGRTAIDEWIKRNPGGFLDLSETNMDRYDLSGWNLADAHLEGSRFIEAQLVGTAFDEANLSHVDLYCANLEDASLVDTLLTGCNLGYANLRGANCSRANFIEAYLYHAGLERTNLTGAVFGRTSLADCDFSKVTGLDRVIHTEESSVAHDTLRVSYRGARNRLTAGMVKFFRGAGVPEELLAQVPKALSAVKYYSCFIACGRPDEGFSRRLRDDLVRLGVSCWLHIADATPGIATWKEIHSSLRRHEKVIIVCSSEGLLRDGLLREIEYQIDEDPDKLVPISRDETWKQDGFQVVRGANDLKPQLLRRNYADFGHRRQYQQSLNRLLKGLVRTSKRPGS